jgi:hypothetical protein
MADLAGERVITGNLLAMTSTALDLAKPMPPASGLRARIGHEILCALVTGLFCGFELLLLITELRPAKIFRWRSKPVELTAPGNLGNGARPGVPVGKISPRRVPADPTRKFC